MQYNLKISFTLIFATHLRNKWTVRDVAQPGSAHVWGAWGRKFKSCRPDFAHRSFGEGGQHYQGLRRVKPDFKERGYHIFDNLFLF